MMSLKRQEEEDELLKVEEDEERKEDDESSEYETEYESEEDEGPRLKPVYVRPKVTILMEHNYERYSELNSE